MIDREEALILGAILLTLGGAFGIGFARYGF